MGTFLHFCDRFLLLHTAIVYPEGMILFLFYAL